MSAPMSTGKRVPICMGTPGRKINWAVAAAPQKTLLPERGASLTPSIYGVGNTESWSWCCGLGRHSYHTADCKLSLVGCLMQLSLSLQCADLGTEGLWLQSRHRPPQMPQGYARPSGYASGPHSWSMMRPSLPSEIPQQIALLQVSACQRLPQTISGVHYNVLQACIFNNLSCWALSPQIRKYSHHAKGLLDNRKPRPTWAR